jgi:hypothetical protein
MSQKTKKYYGKRGLGGLGGALNHAEHLGRNVNRNLSAQRYASTRVQPQVPQTIVLRKPTPTEVFNARVQGKPVYQIVYQNGRVTRVQV